MKDFAAFGELFRTVLHMSAAGAVVILLMLLVRRMLGSRRDPRLFHVLWIAAAVRLLIPWSPPLAFDWRSIVPELPGSGTRTAGQAPALQPLPASPAQSGSLAEGASSIDWMAAACGVWLAGAAAVAVCLAASWLRFRASVCRSAAPADRDGRELQACLDACRAELGIRRRVALRITPLVSSPAVVGVRKPEILVPLQLVGRLDREEWACIIAHELIHVRRRDLLWNMLMTAFAAVHWFNPLAWAACRAMREDQELACDAALMRHVNPVQYGRTLLRAAELQSASGRMAAVTFLSGKTNMARRRMEMLFTTKRTVLTLLAALCIAAVSAVVITTPDLRTGSAASGREDTFMAPVTGRIVWGYGEPKKYNVHAIAIAADAGTPVYAAGEGVVTQAGYENGDGNRIAITHDGDYESVYNHLQDILVKEGEQVKKGQQIGTVGSTGNSTGPHLSFELLHAGEFIDPESVIAFDMPRGF